MPPDGDTAPPQTGEDTGMENGQINADLLKKVVDKVVEMLLRDLRLERERLGASPGITRQRGGR